LDAIDNVYDRIRVAVDYVNVNIILGFPIACNWKYRSFHYTLMKIATQMGEHSWKLTELSLRLKERTCN